MNTERLFKHWSLSDAYEMEPEDRPKTLADMAQLWHDTKFFGYLDDEYITALEEFCLHLKPYGSHPRLYYEYEGFEMLCSMEFVPGTTDIYTAEYDFGDDLDEACPAYEGDGDESDASEAAYDARQLFKETFMKTLPENEGWEDRKKLVV
jgi:hypothetical protein